ncbi:MAG: zeta toxin family protein [Oscillospiraceae bacterium]|nr:zeta toxin family protein [Oscillospiraceae bacterium]
MAKLIIIRGNSGSGKTTVAKKLQEEFGSNTMLISSDMVRLEMLNVRGVQGAIQSKDLMIQLLRYGRRHSEITILEGILPTDDYQELFEAAVEEYEENIFAYYYDIPFEETLLRHQTKPDHDRFGEIEMKRWWREKDYLDIISETKLNKEQSLKEVTELIYHNVVNQ